MCSFIQIESTITITIKKYPSLFFCSEIFLVSFANHDLNDCILLLTVKFCASRFEISRSLSTNLQNQRVPGTLSLNGFGRCSFFINWKTLSINEGLFPGHPSCLSRQIQFTKSLSSSLVEQVEHCILAFHIGEIFCLTKSSLDYHTFWKLCKW